MELQQVMPSVQAAPGGVRAREPWAAGRTLLFVVTEDWYFCSHRLPIARAARDAGFDVVVATRVEDHAQRILDEKFRLVALPWRRRSDRPLRELAALRALRSVYRRESPDIVHHIALKPAVYGALVCPRSVRSASTVAGFGFVSTSASVRARVMRPALRMFLKRHWRRPVARVVVQNPDDRAALVASGMVDASRVTMIRGSGVDIRRFAPSEPPEGEIVVTMVARMLWSKGVAEMVEAARLLRARNVPVRVVLVGEPDHENPEAVPPDMLRAWSREGIIEWRGHCTDMPEVLRATHIAVLPTYREGLPMTLLEAAASARPIVATDVPGCREIVHDGENGVLVPPKNAAALASAIAELAADAPARARMGRRSRELALAFAEEVVVEETLALYRSMLAHGDA